MSYDLVIKNGQLITANDTFNADIAIRGEQIAAIGHNLSGEREVDATGLYVLPGAIDGHVHLTDPATFAPYIPTADSFATASRAAAFGGTTTLIDFAQPDLGQSLIEALDQRQDTANGQTVIDYALHMNLRDPDPARLAEMADVFKRGVPSFKFFMAYEGYRLTDPALLQAMEQVATYDGLAIVHAENHEIIELLQARRTAAGITGSRGYVNTCPAATEGEAIHRALALANVAGARTLIYHISCAEGVREIGLAKARGQTVFGEVCVQYAILTDEVYERDDFHAQSLMVRPPLRDITHQNELWQGLADGRLDIVSTDHNPRPAQTDHHPAGTASIETRLALMYEFGVKTGRISLNRWVEVCCTRPAKVFGLPRKGKLVPGYDADIVLFDPNHTITFSADTLHSAIDFCTYESMSVTGFPITTLSRGQRLVENGQFVGPAGWGQFVERGMR